MPRNFPPTGWIRNDAAVDSVTVALNASRGQSILVGDQAELKGYAQRQIARGIFGVFPWLAEKKLFGSLKRAFHQRRGTCVGQGTTRAIQDSWYWALVDRSEIGRIVEVAVAPIYAGSRVAIGGGRINGDGSVGAWAAEYVDKFGAVPRGVYGRYDLTGNDEQYAVDWGAPGRGVPPEVVEAGRMIKVRAFRCMTGQDMFDVGASGWSMAFCGPRTASTRNSEGISRLSQAANHCTEASGACVSRGGNPLIGLQQSWGDDQPDGPRTLLYKGGSIEMRPGMCMVPLEDYDRELRSGGGECWAFQIVPGHGYRPQGNGR